MQNFLSTFECDNAAYTHVYSASGRMDSSAELTVVTSDGYIGHAIEFESETYKH